MKKALRIVAFFLVLSLIAVLSFSGCTPQKQESLSASATVKSERKAESMDLSEALYDRVKSVLDNWDEDGIYAISFFVHCNDVYEYNGYKNVSAFAVSYNTEADADGAGQYDEERWNYVFWRQNETFLINPDDPNSLIEPLFDWYRENGLQNIGEEQEDCYDSQMNYIGKGPVGHYELMMLAADVARRLQGEGYIAERFGKPIPIIVHDLEYAWYEIEATKRANPDGQADTFLKAMKDLEFI